MFSGEDATLFLIFLIKRKARFYILYEIISGQGRALWFRQWAPIQQPMFCQLQLCMVAFGCLVSFCFWR
jgi:hypothetical protein